MYSDTLDSALDSDTLDSDTLYCDTLDSDTLDSDTMDSDTLYCDTLYRYTLYFILFEYKLYFAINVIQSFNHQRLSVTSPYILESGVPKRGIETHAKL